MRTRFEEQLTRLNAELIDMGTLIEHAIVESTQALGARDAVRARTVMALDRDIDQKEREIESQCLKLLLQQQPVARDLRLISAALKMITDMERIGDQAADVAEIVTMLTGGHEGELPPDTGDGHRDGEDGARRHRRLCAPGSDAGRVGHRHGRQGGRPLRRRQGRAHRAFAPRPPGRANWRWIF